MNAQISNHLHKGATLDLVFEIPSGCAPPSLPAELQGSIPSVTWDDRLCTLVEISSRYSLPLFERVYIIFGFFVTFFLPITTYNVILNSLANSPDELSSHVEQTKLISVGLVFATWLFAFAPLFIWKYMGKRRVRKLLVQWTQEDVRTIPPYLGLPVWKASIPRWCKSTVVLVVKVPVTQSNFYPDACLPPYVAVPSRAAPPYEDRRQSRLARHIDGELKLTDMPLYNVREASMA